MPLSKSLSSKKVVHMLLIIVVVIIAISIGLYAYNAFATKRANKEGFKDIGSGCADARYALIFFYMETCPHCVQFRPEWDKCAKKVNGGKFSNKVCLREYSADVRDMSTKYGVDGYPTVILEDVKTGKKTVYDGPRSVDALMDFVDQHTSN